MKIGDLVKLSSTGKGIGTIMSIKTGKVCVRWMDGTETSHRVPHVKLWKKPEETVIMPDNVIKIDFVNKRRAS